MSHGYARPIVVSTSAGVGATYIPINRYADNITITCDAVGTITFTVDYTLDNIIRSAASSYDVNSENLVAPASANWINLIGSGSVDVGFLGSVQAFGLRVNQTAGTGNVVIRIAQEA